MSYLFFLLYLYLHFFRYIAISKDVGSTSPSDILLFDSSINVERNIMFFSPYHQTHITISNATRKIEVKGPTNRHMDEWMECLEKIQDESPWVREHRFKSYAPIRYNTKVKWFVDGHGNSKKSFSIHIYIYQII